MAMSEEQKLINALKRRIAALEDELRAANDATETWKHANSESQRHIAALTTQINDTGHKTYNAMLKEVGDKDAALARMRESLERLQIRYDEVYEVIHAMYPPTTIANHNDRFRVPRF